MLILHHVMALYYRVICLSPSFPNDGNKIAFKKKIPISHTLDSCPLLHYSYQGNMCFLRDMSSQSPHCKVTHHTQWKARTILLARVNLIDCREQLPPPILLSWPPGHTVDSITGIVMMAPLRSP